MGLGVSVPWMLAWLAAAAVPLLLAWLAVRRPRPVPWAATDLVARAARQQRLTRGGIPLTSTIVRSLLLACAALAASRPFLATRPDAPAAAAGTRLVAGSGTDRIEIVTARPPQADADDDSSLALRNGLEALARTKASPPTIDLVTLATAATGSNEGRTLLVLCDGAVPPPTDAARLDSAVSEGAAVVICIGPTSTVGSDRRRLSAWLDSLVGITIEGRVDFPDTPLEVTADLAAAWGGDAEPATGFVPLPGPEVAAAAELTLRTIGTDDAGPVMVVARTAAGRRPLIVTARRGRGVVCVSALPLTLPSMLPSMGSGSTEARPWSDLAAWPIFVPLLDRLTSQLLSPSWTGGTDPDRTAATTTSIGTTPRSSPSATVSLATVLVAAACGLALVDWLLSARATGSGAGDGLTVRQRAGHAAILAGMIGLLGWLSVPELPRTPARVDHRSESHARPVAIVVDTSPSMAGPGAADPADAGQRRSRLESAVAALTNPIAGDSPLDRIARMRPVTLFTAADGSDPPRKRGRNATAADLRSLAAAPPAAHATRLGDTIESMLADDRGPRPAAILVVTDAAITGGSSWASAARAAVERNVPLIAVPIRGAGADDGQASLPPGFRLTAITAPPLCHAAEAVTIDVRAEAAAGSGPLPISLFGSAASLAAVGSAAAPAGVADVPSENSIATGTLTLVTASATTPATIAMTSREFAGRLTVPPHGFVAADASPGSTLLSPVLSIAAGAAATTIGLPVTDSPIRVLFVETVPRYEWRFLEQLVSTSAAFESQTCMLGAAAAGTASRLRAGAALPQTAADWNGFDVVVLGDVDDDAATPIAGTAPAGATAVDRAQAWSSLREAAAADGIGIAWIPGRRWQEGIGGGPDWLPAAPAAKAAKPLTTPHAIRVTSGGRSSGWLPPFASDPASNAGDASTAFHPEVFAILQPVSLRPTARILATATAVDGTAADSGVHHPAVVIDRIGEGTLVGHLCETWRWRNGHAATWETFWRRTLARLAEPHQRGRLFAATIDVRPLAPETGDRVRIDVVPGRATIDLTEWRLELAAAPTGEANIGTATRQLPLPTPLGPGQPATIVVDGLAAAAYRLRLTPRATETDPPDAPVAPIVRDFIVTEPMLETAGGPVDSGPLEAAALATGGSVVPLREIATLPDAIATAIAGVSGRPRSPQDRTSPPEGWPLAAAVPHLIMLAVVAAAVTAWWQSPDARSRREVS